MGTRKAWITKISTNYYARMLPELYKCTLKECLGDSFYDYKVKKYVHKKTTYKFYLISG